MKEAEKRPNADELFSILRLKDRTDQRQLLARLLLADLIAPRWQPSPLAPIYPGALKRLRSMHCPPYTGRR